MTPERWQQIEALYQAALAVSGEARMALLAKADPEVRQAVERLLAQPDSQQRILDRPAWEATGALTETIGAHVAPGSVLGPYRVEAKIGEGGMGAVFRAFDTKLGRTVAIKILSDDLADAAARRRFQREAQMASSLNHPHILTVHDAGEIAGTQYLVAEYVDGGTLKDWAAAEGRSWRASVELLVGVADGLAAAHGAGILHRDIKPSNILITASGYAKLADFGLAKLAGHPASQEVLTGTGAIIGTIAYMSPEQASGRALDARSDIFSFGIVLFELLAGRRPFAGKTDLEVLQTIIHGTPGSLPDEVPQFLRGMVEKALEKAPEDRYQSMRDFVVDLRRATRQAPAIAPSAASPVNTAPPVSRRRLPWLAALAGAAVILVAAGIAAWRLARTDYFWVNPLQGARFEKLTDWEGTELDAAISHDGKFVTFLSNRDGIYDTFVTQIGSGQFRNLTQGSIPTLLHEMTRTTGFTADGTQVWLRATLPGPASSWATSNLRLVPVMGGPVRPFLTPGSLNPVWSPDGAELAFHHSTPSDPIMLAQPDGRAERVLFTGPAGAHSHYMAWSPDKRYIYFVRNWRSLEGDVWRISTSGGAPEQLTHHNSEVGYPVLLDNRTLLYRATKDDGSGWAIFGMDVEHRIPHQISQGVEEYQSLSASADGRRLVVTVSNPVSGLWKIPITAGIAEESTAARVPVPSAQVKSGRYGRASVLYLAGRGGEGGLWEWKEGRALLLWKSASGRVVSGGVPSPDNRSLAFTVHEAGHNTLYVASSDGTSSHPLSPALDLRGSPSWSPDGRWIAVAADTDQGIRIFKVPVQGGEPVRLTDVLTFNPVWSPDGQRIVVYDASAGGANFPLRAVSPDKTPIAMPAVSYRGDHEGYRFLPDGKSIVVLQGEFRAMDFWLVNLATGERRQLTRLKPGYSVRSFDISPDGKEILFDRVLENSDIVLVDRKP